MPVSWVDYISFAKVVENPFVHALRISGPGADTIAIGGTYSGSCPYPTPSPSPSPSSGFKSSPLPVAGSVLCDEAKTRTGRPRLHFRMNIGGPALVGPNFGAENVNYIIGNKGLKASTSAAVTTTSQYDADKIGLFATERYTRGANLTYKIPVPNVGVYTITTYHAETYFSAAGKRVFSIVMNGIAKEKNLDVFLAARGKNKAISRSFSEISPVNGFITISFTKGVENPVVNAIDVLGYRAQTLAVPGREDGTCHGPSA